jgi:hypothetical protein
MSIAVRQSLYSKLTGATSVTSLLSSSTAVYYEQAPASASFPYLILGKRSKSRVRTMGSVAFQTETWMIKAVDRGEDSDRAEGITEAVEALLTNGTLSISGKVLQDLFPSGDINYVEEDGDQTYQHHGSLYRITFS